MLSRKATDVQLDLGISVQESARSAMMTRFFFLSGCNSLVTLLQGYPIYSPFKPENVKSGI